jgi:hypothetical protein
MLTIRECLLNETPNLNERMIKEISHYVKVHDLKWFPGKNDKGINFLLKELCKVKPNIQAKNLTSAWKKFSKSWAISCEPVAPRINKLIGGEVRKLAALNPQLNLSANVSNINICNWTLVYRWLINPLFLDVTQKITNPQRYQKEVVLGQLAQLSSYTNRPLQMCYPVVDRITGLARTNFDLVRSHPKSQQVYIYELIPRCLTSRDIFETLANKAYLELAGYNFPGRQIYFFFVADSISPDATRALRVLQDPVRFISIKKLAHKLEADAFAIRPGSGKFDTCYINQEFQRRFSLLNPDLYRQIIPKINDSNDNDSNEFIPY